MATTEITLEHEIERTARSIQVASLFDVPIDEPQRLHWTHTLPIEDRPWQVGMIVGPSGAGKSILANRLWPGHARERYPWDGRAIVEGFPAGQPIRTITETLGAVGLGTVPAWLRPYAALSNGERFRADVARALLDDVDPIVVDEFTSVVDRQVAQVASHTVQKVVRRRGRRFVAVTCHYDVEPWLQPDWLYDVAAGEFTWRSVQPRPRVRLTVHEAKRTDWHLFARHHYLSSSLHTAARCYVAAVDGRPVAFTSHIPSPHPRVKNIRRGHRLVVLPDWQGLGIASRLEDWLGQYLWERGYRYRNTVGNPIMVGLYARSPRWAEQNTRRTLHTGPKSRMTSQMTNPRALTLRTFEYVAPKEPR